MTDVERTREFLSEQKYMTVALALDDGMPWAIAVKIQTRGDGYFEWDSRTDTLHSRAIQQNQRVAICMYVVRENSHFGYYAQARAELIRPLKNERARYKATVMHAWINDETFVKRELLHDS